MARCSAGVGIGAMAALGAVAGRASTRIRLGARWRIEHRCASAKGSAADLASMRVSRGRGGGLNIDASQAKGAVAS
ncbi:hypothetical protein FJV41_03390 [Myxococcus llanfairpwllgwyngyllgogerychwyrndrobwllllantysiliogogogochensis]|uniref:Uncharacterized protein n=1 Tax=Myxococcus llanfairpwllgwyngyllgogerychwyrndrobwllllantysiliogogogochensis TaxID=2590453 RepID=A0A540X7Z8_9BACT|nr:hypothetical protein [Myxococcus llanfairpwllgwyngyllgogerychwyrndrobwllllantysiliogogogochensis]TQF17342.1 hypothetical protein FJV41_03390 [Myxococcus llanfairpwllgwyngyllgogerychwyrndrobwllllantysiliogogogochensis]